MQDLHAKCGRLNTKDERVMPIEVSPSLLGALYYFLTAVLNFVRMMPGAMQLMRILSGASS